MLSNSILATVVLASAPLVHAVGKAIVINACQYPVKLCNTPSANGGYTEIDKSLETNETYTQEWTQLSNGNGWSIKLSPDQTLDHILQYEYTFHNDGTIWYDLSEVDGNPWNGNWEITADKSTCKPNQQAYRYATDDAYGMQACPDDAVITVTLCSGESQNDGAAASVSSSVASQTATAPSTAAASSVVATSAPAYSSSKPSSTSQVPVPTTTTVQLQAATPASSSQAQATSTQAQAVSTTSRKHWWTQNKAVAQPTTFATSAVTSTNNGGSVVTNVVTEYETAYVTATAYAKREAPVHVHHGHPHFRA